MKVKSFDETALVPAHEGSILAQGLFPAQEIGAPFGCAFGMLKPGMAQKPERVPESKLYYVRQGRGVIRIDDEEREIREGDLVWIPAGALHTVRNESPEDFGTLAVWWTPAREQRDG